MDCWRLDDEQLRAWLSALVASDREIVAPVLVDGLLLYQRVASAEEIRLEPQGKTRWSAKEFLLQRTETLFSFRFDGARVVLEEPPEPPEQVLIGLRPCDAAGTARLDDILDDDDRYARRRARTTIVSLACTGADPACFCTAVGGSPSSTEASDLQLVPLASSWLLKTVTERGTALLEGTTNGWSAAGEEEWAAADEQRRAVEKSIGQEALPPEWASELAERFDAPLWSALGERCLGCGLCAYVCPSCSCFDVTDSGNAFCGTRCRSWDSCGFAHFTKHAGGYNPRPDQASRYRQRVLHKFSWFPLEHGRFMCVGCGRCVELCPVGLDIRQSVDKAHSAGQLVAP